MNHSSKYFCRLPHYAGAIFAIFSVLFFSGCSTSVKDTTRTFKTVVIDAGHGGQDSGATSRYAGKEKDAALDVAHRVNVKLQAAGFNTVMSRKGDYFVALDRRARISNQQNNSIFVSVHFNYSPKRAVNGAEVYYKSSCSRKVARNILNQLGRIPGVADRGVRTANFRVLKKNQYPAVLVECGYLTNPREGKRCRTPAHREALAAAIARGVIIQRYGSSTVQ